MKLLLLLFLLPLLSLSAPVAIDSLIDDDDATPEGSVVDETPATVPQSPAKSPAETEAKPEETDGLELPMETAVDHTEAPVPEPVVPETDFDALAAAWGTYESEEGEEPAVEATQETPVQPETDTKPESPEPTEPAPGPAVPEVPTPAAPVISDLEAFVDGMSDEEATGGEDPAVDVVPETAAEPEPEATVEEPVATEAVPEQSPVTQEEPTPEAREISDVEAFVDGLGDDEATGNEEPDVDVTEETPVEPQTSEDTTTTVEEASEPAVAPVEAPETPVSETPETPDLEGFVEEMGDEEATGEEGEEQKQEVEETDNAVPVETASETPENAETVVASLTPEEATVTGNVETSAEVTEEEKQEEFTDAALEQIISSETDQEPVAIDAEEEDAAAADAAATESEQPVQPEPDVGPDPTFDGVTLHVALQATWTVSGARRRGYVVRINNGSDREICGVTFTPNSETTDFWNLSVSDDGSFTTKDLQLAPGATANQFGYISLERSRPTINAVTYC